MGKLVEVTGIEEVNAALEQAKRKISQIIEKAAEEIAEMGTREAKKLYPNERKDTHALVDSIDNSMVKVEPSYAESEVHMGSHTFFRGVGKYGYSNKQKRSVSKQPTSDYAWKIEEDENLMDGVSKYLNNLGPRKVAKLLRSVVRRI